MNLFHSWRYEERVVVTGGGWIIGLLGEGRLDTEQIRRRARSYWASSDDCCWHNRQVSRQYVIFLVCLLERLGPAFPSRLWWLYHKTNNWMGFSDQIWYCMIDFYCSRFLLIVCPTSEPFIDRWLFSSIEKIPNPPCWNKKKSMARHIGLFRVVWNCSMLWD